MKKILWILYNYGYQLSMQDRAFSPSISSVIKICCPIFFTFFALVTVLVKDLLGPLGYLQKAIFTIFLGLTAGRLLYFYVRRVLFTTYLFPEIIAGEDFLPLSKTRKGVIIFAWFAIHFIIIELFRITSGA